MYRLLMRSTKAYIDNLAYTTNSSDDIFLDMNRTLVYAVLIALPEGNLKSLPQD